MAVFTLRLDGQAEVERFMASLIDKIADLTPLMEIIGMQLETSTEDNFEGEHSPAGVPWPKSRRAIRDGGKTLTVDRMLRGSITSRATASSVEVGTNKIYARRHNDGFSGIEAVRAHERVLSSVFGVKLAKPRTVMFKAHSRKGNTPKRQFLGLSPHDPGDIEAHAATYLGVAP